MEIVKGYRTEIRKLCLKQLADGVGLEQLAKESGIGRTTLRSWVAHERRRQEREAYLTMDVEKELAAYEKLKKEHAELQRKYERLKLSDEIKKRRLSISKDLPIKSKSEFIYEFLKSHVGPPIKITHICAALGHSPRAYYLWLNARDNRARKSRAFKLVVSEVERLWDEFRQVIGVPKMLVELKKVKKLKEAAIKITGYMVRKAMKYLGIRGAAGPRGKKKGPRSTPTEIEHENILGRDFSAQTPDSRYVSDVTEIIMPDRKAYLCLIMDLCKRDIVGWSVGWHHDEDLTLRAFREAFSKLSAHQLRNLLVHTDRGGEYRGHGLQDLFDQHSVTHSLSAPACCADNAACESLNAIFEFEFIRRHSSLSLSELRTELKLYIEFYNEKRTHSHNDYLPPTKARALAIATC